MSEKREWIRYAALERNEKACVHALEKAFILRLSVAFLKEDVSDDRIALALYDEQCNDAALIETRRAHRRFSLRRVGNKFFWLPQDEGVGRLCIVRATIFSLYQYEEKKGMESVTCDGVPFLLRTFAQVLEGQTVRKLVLTYRSDADAAITGKIELLYNSDSFYA
ncbi:MAG: hypothetical protein HYV25_00900 [Candidatus Harrisonbacteria bacterium]|nr:hypothetical protein [Candidatus Harrisonbacteria bacterium]